MEISTDFIIATSAIWIILLLGVFIIRTNRKNRHDGK
jgi:hypothetical protein